MSETLEQIAVRLAQWIIWAQGGTPTPDEERIRIRVAKLKILAALREAEARGEQRAATLGGTLLDSCREQLAKAEAENARLREALTAAQVRANELAARVKELEMEAEARDFAEMREERP
jgi:predicted nuclease with TOPRIM domain